MFQAASGICHHRGRMPNIIWQAFSTRQRKVLLRQRDQKNSSLFIAMLEKAAPPPPTNKTITLILDNYIIHKNKQTERWLKKNPKFCLVFQPVYSLGLITSERLWHKLHETITRNHQCRGWQTCWPSETLHGYHVSPFPGMAMARKVYAYSLISRGCRQDGGFLGLHRRTTGVRFWHELRIVGGKIIYSLIHRIWLRRSVIFSAYSLFIQDLKKTLHLKFLQDGIDFRWFRRAFFWQPIPDAFISTNTR